MKFNPCIDQCTHDGTHCQGCGRSHEDIIKTKKMVMALVNFAQEKNYDNIKDFSNAVGATLLKKLSAK
ncbi:MAG: DUF1289 domain-containing protein [Methylococcales bacterium]|nr:DUF1289 domain-containing protein [Methylococcales bacterium]MCK5926361.1 DUF1289 domain-containing protein [Methylococcales bacterium]